jgi:hypothetical protein
VATGGTFLSTDLNTHFPMKKKFSLQLLAALHLWVGLCIHPWVWLCTHPCRGLGATTLQGRPCRRDSAFELLQAPGLPSMQQEQRTIHPHTPKHTWAYLATCMKAALPASRLQQMASMV